MSHRILRIFLSSTSDDLGPHRDRIREVLDRLRQHAVHMGAFGARPARPLEVCRHEVEQCDALIVVVGHRYGWIPSVADGGDGAKSITWWEVHWALENGIPVFAFLVDPKAGWVGAKEQDRLQDDEEDAAEVRRAVRSLKQFRRLLENRVTRELFDTVDGLGAKVATSLASWLAEQRNRLAPVEDSMLSARNAAAAMDAPAWAGSPFPGLRAFTPADQPIFFGRGRETDHLVEQLGHSRCRFVLIHGTSGSGKSSLVAAGLLPRLKSGALPGSDRWSLPDVSRPPGASGSGPAAAAPVNAGWHGLRFTPGELGPDPFLALANKLAPLLTGGRTPRVVAEQLRGDEQQLALLVEEALDGAPTSAEALLFVDQFEELVTIVADAELQRGFVKALASAARDCARVRIVATVRADFYHRCIEAQPELADVLRDHGASVPLAGPGPLALADMVRRPAERAGLDFEPPGLVDELVHETVSRTGGLALMALALDELYRGRTGNRLTATAYRAFGGLSGVVNARATATFDRLPQAARDRLHTVFSHLVVVDEHGVATRARALRAGVANSPEANALIDAFIDARLLVTDRGIGGATTIEVAHEALLREWPKLADWITARADDLRLRRQVETAALEWHRHAGALPGGENARLYFWAQERLDPVYAALERLDVDRHQCQEPLRSFLGPEWERLVDEIDDPATTHQRRAAIGDRLADLRDPRPGVGVGPDGTPDIVWCDIPGGTVEIEGQGALRVDAFGMAKFPVTYTQYRAFLQDPNGYARKALWKGLEREDEPGEQYRSTANCPAENVSWFDAVAFCRWLQVRLRSGGRLKENQEVRLPTEWEWQQAATGGRSENVYPWPGDWDGQRANTSESRLSRTTAVGMYPGGASSQGVLDLAGNVCEWCSNRYDEPKGGGKQAEGGVVRLLRTILPSRRQVQRPEVRGGSWRGAQVDARASFRSGNRPGLRYSYVGIRVVCVSPIR